ncbi:MAG: hypothetical protein QNK31_12645 [Porticoccus sp.]|nr:hypothetical protein [Porticoccus sp.]
MSIYKRYRFSLEILSQAVWLYYRFNFSHSHRDIEDLPVERGIVASYEYIHFWYIKFGLTSSRWLRRRHQGYRDTFFIEEVFLRSMVSSVTCDVPLVGVMMRWMYFFKFVEILKWPSVF